MKLARVLLAFLAAATATALLPSAAAMAQTVAAPAGIFIEAEGQWAFGQSDFQAGFVPDSIFVTDVGRKAMLDDGDGSGGALTLGYIWSNGWSVAARYRRLETDDTGGPVVPGILAFAPGIPFLPGGIPFGVLDARTTVDSEISLLDVEVSKEFSLGGARLQLFGGLTHASIERDVAIIDGCACAFALRMANDFHGAGPKIGLRGGIPITDALRLVGSGSAAALFGTSKFTSRLDDPLFPAFAFKNEDDRTVTALSGEAGIAIGIGLGSLTLGYRIDAVLEALDTDQRVSELAMSVGFPAIGNRHDDFVAHGPFARFTLPFAALGN